jgi:hypothetical protein
MATFAEERWSISLAFQKTKLLKQQLKDRWQLKLPTTSNVPAVFGMSLDESSILGVDSKM